MGLRTGPIQEGSQPGPRLNRKARAGKDPKAHSRGMRNQACSNVFISAQRYRLRALSTLGMINQPTSRLDTGSHPLHDCAPDLVRAIFALDDFSIDHGERVVEAIICPSFGVRRGS